MRRIAALFALPLLLAAVPARAQRLVTTGCAPTFGEQAAGLEAVVNAAKARYGLRAVIAGVSKGPGRTDVKAVGESTPGVPATTDMHVRDGAVTHWKMTTLLMKYVDQRLVALDDPLSKWRPDLPSSSKVTVRMLANMTSGYYDYVKDDSFIADFYANPYRVWTPAELVARAMANPGNLPFAPGTGFNYAHTNYVLLGEVLEKVGGAPIRTLLRREIFEPLNLRESDDPTTAELAEPALHTWQPWGDGWVDSTYWDPSWTSAPGTANVCDLLRFVRAAGTGALVSRSSFVAQVAPNAYGPSPDLGYGLGLLLSNGWQFQTPSYAGFYGIAGYLPSQDLSVVVFSTLEQDSPVLDAKNAAVGVFRDVVSGLAPLAPLPTGRIFAGL